MGRFFNLDAPIWEWIGHIADIIILSCIWWICCIPIVTIGDATTAFFYVMGKKIRQESTNVFKDFFKALKENFMQSLGMNIIMLIAMFSMSIYIYMTFYSVMEKNNHMMWLLPITIIFAFEILNIFTYAWALLSRFHMKTKEIIKTAIIMTHKHLLTSLGNVCAFVIGFMIIYHVPLIVFCLPGIIITLSSVLIQKIFATYTDGDESSKSLAQ